MTESTLKTELMKRLQQRLRTFVAIRHEDRTQFGIPDISITGNGKTTWWEVKYAKPDFKSLRIQDVRMWHLNRAGYARYIIYYETVDGDHQVVIAKPESVIDIRTGKRLQDWRNVFPIAMTFDHGMIAEYIASVHAGV